MVAIIAGIMVIISCFGNGDSDGGGLVLLGMLDGYGLRAGGDDNNKIWLIVYFEVKKCGLNFDFLSVLVDFDIIFFVHGLTIKLIRYAFFTKNNWWKFLICINTQIYPVNFAAPFIPLEVNFNYLVLLTDTGFSSNMHDASITYLQYL